jgi:hypothetical protein
MESVRRARASVTSACATPFASLGVQLMVTLPILVVSSRISFPSATSLALTGMRSLERCDTRRRESLRASTRSSPSSYACCSPASSARYSATIALTTPIASAWDASVEPSVAWSTYPIAAAGGLSRAPPSAASAAKPGRTRATAQRDGRALAFAKARRSASLLARPARRGRRRRGLPRASSFELIAASVVGRLPHVDERGRRKGHPEVERGAVLSPFRPPALPDPHMHHRSLG